jgi:hypothetical protein
VIRQQPSFDLANDNAKAHERAGRWQPLCDEGGGTAEVLIKIDQDQPGVSLCRSVVAWESPAKIGLSALNLDSMHNRTVSGHNSSQYCFV